MKLSNTRNQLDCFGENNKDSVIGVKNRRSLLSFSSLQTGNLNDQTGRSMVEILGVLVVIGVLSVGGLYAYNLIVDKHKANTVMEKALDEAVSISAKIREKAPLSIARKNRSHFSSVEKVGLNHFKISLIPLDVGVCKQLKSISDSSSLVYEMDNECSYMIFANLLGENSAIMTDLCTGKNCGNGFCSDGKCICRNDYYGENCESAPLNCQNGGSWNSETKECDCDYGYSGEVCQTESDPCYGVDCGDHGSCVNGACVCTDNYYGSNCENSPLTCLNGGTWNPSTHVCDCPNGYSGNTCAIKDPCLDVNCGTHGTCSAGTCVCEDGYSGDKCETKEGTCTSYLDCNEGEYCQFSPESSITPPVSGICHPLSTCNDIGTYNEFWMFAYGPEGCYPEWWTAQDICRSKGMTMVSLSDLNCSTNDYDSRCSDPNKLWDKLGKNLKPTIIGTTTEYYSASQYTVDLSNGDVIGGFYTKTTAAPAILCIENGDTSGQGGTADPCANVNCGDHGTCQNGACVCDSGYSGTNCETDIFSSCTSASCCTNAGGTWGKGGPDIIPICCTSGEPKCPSVGGACICVPNSHDWSCNEDMCISCETGKAICPYTEGEECMCVPDGYDWECNYQHCVSCEEGEAVCADEFEDCTCEISTNQKIYTCSGLGVPNVMDESGNVVGYCDGINGCRDSGTSMSASNWLELCAVSVPEGYYYLAAGNLYYYNGQLVATCMQGSEGGIGPTIESICYSNSSGGAGT